PGWKEKLTNFIPGTEQKLNVAKARYSCAPALPILCVSCSLLERLTKTVSPDFLLKIICSSGYKRLVASVTVSASNGKASLFCFRKPSPVTLSYSTLQANLSCGGR